MAVGPVRLLAVESATDLVGAALLSPDGSVAERSHVGGRAHAELLAPAIEEVCTLAGCTLAEVDTVAVDIGPGLFTGLRVGVASAKALGQSLGIGVLGVTSLDVLAAGAREAAGPERAATVLAVVDARRREVFTAAYRFGPGSADIDPAAVREDRVEALDPVDVAIWLGALASDGPVLVVGDGAIRYLDVLGPVPGADCGMAGHLSAPSPAVLARLAARRLAGGAVPVAAGELVPDYRRHADARINWEERVPQRSDRSSPDGP